MSFVDDLHYQAGPDIQLRDRYALSFVDCIEVETMTERSTPRVSIAFAARDGFQLKGTYFPASDGDRSPVLICPATGIRQSFYFPFADWLRKDGHSTFVFDYRGIGASLGTNHVRQSRARKQDWGQLDMPAALEWLLGETGAHDAHLIGHSAGAQLVGLMPNHASVRSLCAISASSGFVGNIRWPKRFAALLLAHMYVPISVRLLGYVPARVLGWGDDLPPCIGLQWARWCRRPGYVANEFGAGVARHYYDKFTAPVTIVAATDDPLATPANIADWLRLLPSARSDVHFIHPENPDGRAIGHVGMFRREHSSLWPELTRGLRR
ncbi:alpha/beta hydrolase family protein [Burkholderia lata]|uniref:alpha/beta hydrolase family protein n=1 Tax=Burkholderia lata (strain ATCC 17760 / DSM 23089 / LMG 22485 / NCIMB 9086 / R18194 / 383) TaxID=482957 RepID=UPI0020C691FD|nr:alpha/beta fold hydrolase [Burkholderia lata]